MSDRKHVVIAVSLDEPLVERARQIASDRARIELLSRAARRAYNGALIDDPSEAARARRELDDALATADALYSGYQLPPDLFERAPRLRWIQVMSAGTDRAFAGGHVTGRAALTSASGAHATPIGEWIIGAMLAFAKGLPASVRAQERHEWRRVAPSWPAELRDGVCGIIGMGAIGSEVARLAAAFGMRVLATRWSATAERREGGVTVLPASELPRVLSESDYVVITAPLTPKTHGLIGAAELARMKPTAVLVNIARGEMVDEAALIEALRDGRLRGAALDVFAQEPLPPDSAFWDMENVLVSPHASGNTGRLAERIAEVFLDNLGRFLAGEPLRNRADPARGY